MLRIIILLTIPVLISCATKSKVPLNNDTPLLEDAMIQNDVDKKANMLAQEYIITDGPALQIKS